MKKISMFIVMLLICLLSFGYPHHHFHHHHVYHHKSSRPTMTYRRTPAPKPKPHPHHRYVKDPVTNQIMLYFIIARGTNSYRHEGRDYVRCESCGKVFILKGQRFCKKCIKTGKHKVHRISKK